jgi:inosine-uridine nucleoside N-ribohydrolase
MTATEPSTRLRLWIDTDIGDDPDDAVALAMAARHPNVDIIGVSTVYRDVEWRAREARALLAEFGCAADVIAGPPSPNALAATSADALLAIGPLTNIAHLSAHEAAFPRRVVIMGGALATVHHRGEDMRIEYNFGRDPAATEAVVGACQHSTIVPLDVTARLCVSDAQEATLRHAARSLDAAIARWRAERGVPVCLHDPLALLVLLDEAPVSRERRRIAVDSDGAIVSDDADGTEHDVVVAVDPPAAIARIIEIVTGGVRSTR